MKREGATKYYQATEIAKELGHAPLPWRITDFGDSSSFAAIHIEAHVPVGGGTGMTIAELYHYDSFKEVDIPRSVVEANAQMIVTAVNEREQLRDAIQELLNRFYPHQCDRGPICYKCRALRQGTAALANHKGPSE